MERIVLPRRITQDLSGFAGETVEDKIVYLAEQVAAANLRDCNEHISRFESRYGQVFADFESAWDRGKIPDAHGYRTETDFIEWEALELEKEHWLATIDSLSSGD